MHVYFASSAGGAEPTMQVLQVSKRLVSYADLGDMRLVFETYGITSPALPPARKGRR